MKLELVSCIMPTKNRLSLLKLAVAGFLRQDYLNAELLVVDSSDSPCTFQLLEDPRIRYYHVSVGKTVGESRNYACEKARGNIIAHLDDDDIYADDWVSNVVHEVNRSGADIYGLATLKFYALRTSKFWNYSHPISSDPWVYGGTFAYRKSFWQKHRFQDFQAGEDNDFLTRSSAKVQAINYHQGYIGVVHDENIGMLPFDNPRNKIAVIKWMKDLKQAIQAPIPSRFHDVDTYPKITCIMPTADRRKFITSAIAGFQTQDYPNKELVIVDDGTDEIRDLIGYDNNVKYTKSFSKQTIGTKRNFACQHASGEIIVHWDDDDWYAPNWISHQVHFLLNTGVDICGLDQVQFYSVLDDKYWTTKNYNSRKLWLSGATLAYRKSFWEKCPFKDIQIGEDDAFVRNPKAKVQAHDYYQGFIALIHPKNTSIKVFQQ